jgi:hypothetical protein
MRTLNVGQLKRVIRDHRCDLIFCQIGKQWFIDNQGEVEHINLESAAAELLAKWGDENAIIRYKIGGATSKDLDQIVFDAWRSVQAYGRQPHLGYLKATEYGIQCNNEHFDDSIVQMDEFLSMNIIR